MEMALVLKWNLVSYSVVFEYITQKINEQLKRMQTGFETNFL